MCYANGSSKWHTPAYYIWLCRLKARIAAPQAADEMAEFSSVTISLYGFYSRPCWQSGKTLDRLDRQARNGLTECGHSLCHRQKKRRFNSYSAHLCIAGSFKGQDLGLSKGRLKVRRAKYTRKLGQYQPLGPKTDDVSSILTPAAIGAHSKLFKEQSFKLSDQKKES